MSTPRPAADRTDRTERRRDAATLAGVLACVGALLVLAAWFDRQRPAAVPSVPLAPPTPRPTDREVRYQVAPGQDPAVVIAALDLQGFQVAYDDTGTAHDLVVADPAGEGVDREQVRSVLETTSIPREGSGLPWRPVRFVDEA